MVTIASAKKAPVYNVGDMVVIKRTQFGSGLKIRPKFLGPYEIVKINPHDRYDVKKVSNTEGPITTSTSAEFMKRYFNGVSEDEDASDQEEAGNDVQSLGGEMENDLSSMSNISGFLGFDVTEDGCRSKMNV